MSDEREYEIFEGFAEELLSGNAGQSRYVSRDAAYVIGLQQNKMEALGLTAREKVKPSGAHIGTTFGVSLDSPKYRCSRLIRGYVRVTEFFRDGKRICRRKDHMNLYMNIITAKDGIDPRETYCCPSCGGISTLEELEKGCKGCGASFIMTDLFPKVTDYFWLRNYSGSEKEMLGYYLKWLAVGVIAGIIAGIFIPIVPDGMTRGEYLLSFHAIAIIIASGVTGFICSFFAAGMAMLGRLVIDSIKVVPILTKTVGDKKRLAEYMRPMDPYFSTELFEGRVIALMKIMLYGEGLSESSVCCGQVPPPTDVIDAAYTNAMDIQKTELQGDHLYITLDVYADCTHFRNGRIRVTRDRIHMKIFKNVHAVTDPGFSIHKVECPSCGASFDASRTKQCPYCHRDYRLFDYDWAVLEIENRR